jgi:peptidase E
MSLENQIAIHRKLIGLNNFRPLGGEPAQLEYARPHLEQAFKDAPHVVYVGYAATNMETKTEIVSARLRAMGARHVEALHTYKGNDLLRAIDGAGAIFLDGGNTYRLIANLKGLRHDDGRPVDPREGANADILLIEPIRHHVAQGKTLIGLSAGSYAFCSDVRIADDPTSAVQKKADGSRIIHVDGLNLLSNEDLELTLHYEDPVGKILTEQESAALDQKVKNLIYQVHEIPDRIGNALDLDPKRLFLAVRDLSYVVINGYEMQLEGRTGAVIFEKGKELQEITARADLSKLLLPNK